MTQLGHTGSKPTGDLSPGRIEGSRPPGRPSPRWSQRVHLSPAPMKPGLPQVWGRPRGTVSLSEEHQGQVTETGLVSRHRIPTCFGGDTELGPAKKIGLFR